MFSESEIRNAAEVQVWRGVYYDANRKPFDNGLLDPHMVRYSLPLFWDSNLLDSLFAVLDLEVFGFRGWYASLVYFFCIQTRTISSSTGK